MSKERVFYLDVLRVLATFSVVVLHIAAQNWYSSGVRSFSWNVFNFYDSIVRFSVPVFCMISGALFLNKDVSARAIYTKYLPRLLFAFLISSSAYAFWDFFWHDKSLKETVLQVFRGHYHLWFLPMIAGLYAACPVLKKIVDDAKTEKYFLFCAFLFSFAVPQAFSLLNIRFSDLKEALDKTFATFDPKFFSSFSFYFVLGHFLANADFSKRQRMAVYAIGVAGAAWTVIATAASSRIMNAPCEYFYNNFSINVLAEALAVFAFAKYNFSQSRFFCEHVRLVNCLSKLTFGAYLAHAFFIERLSHFHLTTASFNAVLSVPAISFFVWLLSNIASAVLNKIPVLKNIL